MQNAAQALAEEVRRLRPRRLLVACGPGNNGGDGLAMAALLADEMEVRILLAEPAAQIRQPEARWALDQIDPARTPVQVYDGPVRFRELAASCDLVVDALLGSGTRGDPRGTIGELVRLINASRKPVLSVDVPSGLGTRLQVRPKVTVALHARKEGMTARNSGRILVRDIGIPPAAVEQVGPADFFVPYPRNPPDSHKGQNGRVLVVAGGPYTGAAILCASAALRSGVDLVRLYAPSDAARAAQGRYPDLIVHPATEARRLVEEDVAPIRSLMGRVDAVLVGPGLGEDRSTVEAIRQILRAAASLGVKTVLDADALVVAGQDERLVRRLRPLATPHHGEFREFTGRAVPKDWARAKTVVQDEARRLRSTLLVKGAVDLISDGRRTKENHIHHPGMTVGGTGDVLAGLCAGFVSKGMEPFRAACAAAFVNGEAGRRAAGRQGGSLVATDLVREMPRVFRTWLP